MNYSSIFVSLEYSLFIYLATKFATYLTWILTCDWMKQLYHTVNLDDKNQCLFVVIFVTKQTFGRRGEQNTAIYNSPDRILICNNKCFSLRGSVALWGKCQYCIRIISRSRLVEFLISNDRDRTAGLLILIVVKRNQFFDSFFRKFRRTYMFLPYKISIESSECYSALKSMSENKCC